jgi:hypothetical protein
MPDKDEETYIGDGVYASFDGWHVWLRTGVDGREHRIALEPPVLAALTDYGKRIWAPPAAEDGPE